MIDAKQPLIGLTASELRQVAIDLGLPAYTGGQIAKWLYEKHVTHIDEMTNLSKAARQRLSENYCVGVMAPITCQVSKDGTVKYLFPVRTTAQPASLTPTPSPLPPHFVETVYIPDGDRATLCVSCQVGCKMNCLFCQTGKQGFEGQLTAADILNQIYALQASSSYPVGDTSASESRQVPTGAGVDLTNIVFMGQGEPMDNLDAVLRATEILTASDGYAWSPKRITVSSVGVKNKLKRFLDESQCHVAISMHSPLHEQRLQLMPAEKAMPISETVALLRQYDFTHQRRCSFEYICFGGLNDSLRHGQEIVRLVQGLECRVNLIRFHAIPDVNLPASDPLRMEQLRDYLTAHGVFATIRASRGEDILAACGLLSTKEAEEVRSRK
ncbi:MAG: 23S rRNA (adenine(2503)-C(2))-methyltransferase RlmN [Prevotella sp.]|nr:23S rRNA (adenine(2503)-C(2))-methyltransferase RlmN [Prevotella sp.]